MAGGAHYVNNQEFLAAIVEWKNKVKEAEDSGEDPPRVTNYIGECFYKIATHLSYKGNFINYSYRNDMILDGVENCLAIVKNFDPSKSNNPFAYFTQVIYYSFLRTIAKEKKQSYVKQKLIQQMPFEAFELQEHDESGEHHNTYLEYMQMNNDFDDFIERKKQKRKQKKTSKTNSPLEDLLKDDE